MPLLPWLPLIILSGFWSMALNRATGEALSVLPRRDVRSSLKAQEVQTAGPSDAKRNHSSVRSL